MAGKFRLAGVLRLRRLEEDGAKAALAGAHADLARTVEEAGGLAAYLDASPERPTTSAALSGLAASRATASALFSVLESEERVRAHAVDEARAELARARAAALGLEKLEERHDAETARAEGRADQAALDEIASAARRTTAGGSTT